MNEQLIKKRIPQRYIPEFCKKWKVDELAAFGSVLEPEYGPDSDIDVLITFNPNAKWGIFAFIEMREELEKMFEREVDLVSRRGLESSRNYLRRESILSSIEVLYAAA